MEKKEALEKYSAIFGREILTQYKDADQEIVVNHDDDDLKGIAIPLPKPPDWKYIAGFGLPAKQQKMDRYRPVMPNELIKLTRKRHADGPKKGDRFSPDDIWDYIEQNIAKYEKEIEWIEREWYFRLYGFWAFINGKPTYITGKHYFFIFYWYLDIGNADYRGRDRRYWIFREFCENDTYDFVDKDKNGRAIAVDGYYRMKDLGRRVAYGFVYPKFRREGATFRAECDNYETTSKAEQANSAIQSKTELDARTAFIDKLVKPAKRMAFFFRPNTIKLDPKKINEFDAAISGAAANLDIGLQSSIRYESSDEGALDGDRLLFFHDDEIGKCKDVDVNKRHAITKKCLATANGFNITGFTVKTSTAGEMEGGGENFQKLIEQSDFYTRTENGQTLSGLYNFFISSIDGLFVDEFGESVIDDPEQPTVVKSDGNSFITTVGSRSFLENNRAAYLRVNDLKGWHEEVRAYPIQFAECFLSESNSLGFNLQILSSRIQELNMKKNFWVVGDLIRIDPSNRFSKIRFEENPNGRFKISRLPTSFEENRFYKNAEDGWHYPLNTNLFNAGGDPFKFNETEGGEMSDGGLAIKMKFNNTYDGDVPIEKWQSDRFVLTYRYRPDTKKEFTDDCLKACLFYGCSILSETNVPQIIDDFTEWGAYPFLKFLNGRNTPGFHSGPNSKQELFMVMRDYIQRRGKWENHLDLLKECLSIPDFKKMNKYDLLTASGLAEIAEQQMSFDFEQDDDEASFDVGSYIGISCL